jgi:hypothetical protein
MQVKNAFSSEIEVITSWIVYVLWVHMPKNLD